ncbi:hypothetical protein ACROYT_G031290 [Oculina patagonica]
MLRVLPSGVFDHNTRLEKLWLNSNQLGNLPTGIFDNNTQLSELSKRKDQTPAQTLSLPLKLVVKPSGNYLCEDEEAEATDNWIAELQDLFVKATALKIDYVNDIRVSEARARADESREESNRKEREQIQRAAEQAFVKRETARAILDTLCDSTAHTLEGERISVSLMKKLQSQLGDAFRQCKMAHDKLLELLDRQSAETEIKWIAIVQGKYNELVEQLENHIDADENKDSKPTGGDCKVKQAACATSTNLHLEKIRMPRFEGELKEYSQFKSDFQKQVMPHLTRDTAPYTLRSCLGKEPLARVKSVDDDIEEM